MVESFIADQRNPESVAKLPPTRVSYLWAGWMWKRLEFGDAPALDLRDRANASRDPVLVSLHRVTCLSAILLLLLSGVVVYRMLGAPLVPGVLLAMACAPLQLHMSQHALMDGFFALWAMLCLWGFWESLRHPEQKRWLVLYGVTLGILVLSKENAFFVYIAILGLALLNRVTGFGTVTRRFWVVSAIAPLTAMGMLVLLAGGIENLFDLFHLLVTKFNAHPYAINTASGPWHRYLVDELVMSPFILCLAIGGFFTLSRERREFLFLTCFVVFTYAMMCNVRHGMNLRFATIWDLPLRTLAVGQLAWVTTSFGSRRQLAFTVGLILMCGYGLWQYWILFVQNALLVTPSESLFRAVEMVK
jgi:4-amino-4-deoxy-L-arabinose transferase-like glycosyltransferase